MDREESWRVIDEQRVGVADLLEGLPPEQWATPSLCSAWTVRDVGAHLSGAATISVGAALRAAWAARGNYDRMIRDVTIERGRRPTEQIVADLRDVVGSRRLAPGTVWRDPLFDIVVHGQDIARPLGVRLDPEPPLDAVRESADWIWRRKFPFGMQKHLDGLRLIADDCDWARGAGTEVRGPVMELLMLSSGRATGLAGVSGPGADEVRTRFAA